MNIQKILILLAFTVASGTSHAKKKIMLLGGHDHDVYLGCINCSYTEPGSIHNDIGSFGSDIASTSIFNHMGQYGSDTSQYSPCNDIAWHPPVIVDEDGGFYGYLTLNDMIPHAIDDPDIVAWLKYKVCKK